jgi:anti-anti-sigma factor
VEIHDERVGDTCVVTAKGRLDGNASADFADHVGRLIESQNPKLLIDFTSIDFVSSAGVWAVLVLSRRIKSAGGSLALCSVRDSVREVLDVSDFASMLSIHSARAEAIAAMGK